MRIDMHVHTNRSFDCLTRPEDLIEAMYERGLDMVCITDHNEIAAALELKAQFPDEIIVGEEVKTAENVDIIGLFIKEKIPKGTPARETCDIIHAQGGIVYVPHPFAGGKGGGGRILPQIEDAIDAFEGFNARLHDHALNERAIAWGKLRYVPLGAGSDAHTIAEVGRAWVDVPPFEDNPRSFIASLRQGRLHGTTSPRHVHIASTYAKLHKRVFGESD